MLHFRHQRGQVSKQADIAVQLWSILGMHALLSNFKRAFVERPPLRNILDLLLPPLLTPSTPTEALQLSIPIFHIERSKCPNTPSHQAQGSPPVLHPNNQGLSVHSLPSTQATRSAQRLNLNPAPTSRPAIRVAYATLSAADHSTGPPAMRPTIRT